jgi:hypothetical protein
MRKWLFPLLVLLIACGTKKDPSGTKNENNDYLLSMNGLDSIKLDMSKAELEKLLKTPLKFKHIGIDYSPDTINVKYRDMDVLLYMDGSSDSTAALRGIQTASSSCKTEKGIGVGNDKIAAIEAYEDNLKYVGPVYEVYPVRSLTKSVVAVMDTAMAYRAIVFYIVDRKVVSMELSSSYEFY